MAGLGSQRQSKGLPNPSRPHSHPTIISSCQPDARQFYNLDGSKVVAIQPCFPLRLFLTNFPCIAGYARHDFLTCLRSLAGAFTTMEWLLGRLGQGRRAREGLGLLCPGRNADHGHHFRGYSKHPNLVSKPKAPGRTATIKYIGIRIRRPSYITMAT